jgi:hypothetical protein
LAREPDLIRAIRRDIAAVGVVGEGDNAMLAYLVFTSRVLESPGAVVTRGRSSTGKSTLLKRVATLFPPAVKIEAMTMTNAAWFNTPDDFFMHKIFLGGERKHSQDNATRDAGALLRQLLSEKRVNRGVSIWDEETKRWKTEMVNREGPIAYAESTTSQSAFEEDLNRMLQLYVDESPAQNRRVIEAMAVRYDPDAERVDTEAVIARHHEFQNYLQKLPTQRVGIPFANALARLIPHKRAESRRTTQQLFTVIESAVLLRQHLRARKNGFVIATLEDYALARQLLLAPLQAALGIGSDYEKAKLLRSQVDGVFTTPDVKRALGFTNDMGPSRLLNGLVNAGFILRVTEQRGNSPATYRWVNDDDPNLETIVLPTVEQVRKAHLTT